MLLEREDATDVDRKLTEWLGADQSPAAPSTPALGSWPLAWKTMAGIGACLLVFLIVLIIVIASRSQNPIIIIVPSAKNMETLSMHGLTPDTLDTSEQFANKVQNAGLGNLRYEVSEDQDTNTRELRRLVVALRVQNNQLVAAMRYLTEQLQLLQSGPKKQSQVFQSLLPSIEVQLKRKTPISDLADIDGTPSFDLSPPRQDLGPRAPDMSLHVSAARPPMVPIRSGRFQMGSPGNVPYDNEKPAHEVLIQTPFLMSATEVTQAQYEALMGENPSYFKDGADAPNRPVENVSWLDAVRYCNKLSQREKLESCYVISGDRVEWPKRQGCTGYRLPTEAEWEYAARAGEAGEYAGSQNVAEVAWYAGNSGGQTHAVGTTRKKTNRWGLSDMSGNVWEWVWDWYKDSYEGASSTDPTGPKQGVLRVRRGGSYDYEAVFARVAFRFRGSPSYRDTSIGFRLARSNP
ncbi:MAG: formylglycine-generating enzyme family protein [Myxococcales bacterium]|nr:formylglycine-generating enzyme family protein [Myxococcales bacterium]